MKLRTRKCAVFTAVFTAVFILIFSIFYGLKDLFPEIDMVLNSPCSNPLSQWDGKILRFQVWFNAMKRKPLHFNIHHEHTINNSYPAFTDFRSSIQKPVIYWGTHHKTGTFLAKKIFSKICARMSWCCIFLSSRDSIHSMNAALYTEPLDVLGHNHWVWGPRFEGMKNYRFVHFYRKPFKKILSGYRYHYEGIEEWTKKILPYEKACAFSNSTLREGQEISLDSMLDHCTSVHICETSCRKAHEFHQPNLTRNDLAPKNPRKNIFRSRSPSDYDFLCTYLGKKLEGRSLQQGLQEMTPEEGVLTQAALDFYEVLRMAAIYNETISDRRSLNLDLDFVSEDFNNAMWILLEFLKDLIPDPLQRKRIHDELKFYDLNSSPLYRLSMANPVINHVNIAGKKNSSVPLNLRIALESNKDFALAYRQIFDLFEK